MRLVRAACALAIHWLVGISAAFILIERLLPWRKEQRALRPGWLRDLAFFALNGHFFSLWTAALTGAAALAATKALHSLGLRLEGSPVPRWPFLAQFLLFLVLADFLQWCIHNLLHRVPWLWTSHTVHHSITTMDWIGNWAFHWMEIVVYRSLQWLLLAWHVGHQPTSVDSAVRPADNAAVGRRWSSAAGCAALWAMLAPHAAGLVVAVHLAGQHEPRHDAPHQDGAAGLAIVWHGHAHDAGTPQHDHAVLAPNAVPALSKAIPHPNERAPFLASVESWRGGGPSTAWLRPTTSAGVGPPTRTASLLILRI